MVNMTLAISEELNKLVKKHKEVNWSEVARHAMWSYAEKLELLDTLTRAGKMDLKSAEGVRKIVNKGLSGRSLTQKEFTELDSWAETLEIMCDHDFLEGLERAQADVRAGRVHELTLEGLEKLWKKSQKKRK